MPDKKLTDAEIKKALECCMKLTPDCDDCPYWGVRDFGNCFDFAGQDALDLINRYEADNERLEHQLETLCFALKLAKAEAYKECIEKVKSISIKKVISYVTDFSIQEQEIGWLEIRKESLDNLLNELVGDNK